MKKLFTALIFALLLGCATTPRSDVQTVYVAEQSLIQTVNVLVAAHSSGKLVGDDYENAKKIEKAAKEALFQARAAARKGDASGAETALTAFSSLMSQLAVYKGESK